MYTLGIHGGVNTISKFKMATPINWLHDAAAVLCKDGIVIAAVEEERFARIKHVSYFPVEAIRYCLNSEHITLAQVTNVVLSSQHMNDFLAMTNRWQFGTRAWLVENDFAKFAAEVLKSEFEGDIPQVLFSNHHMSHALGAVWQSGFSEALCVVLDGWGDGVTGSVVSFQDGKLDILRVIDRPGPATMYLIGTQVLGYDQFDEYKIMGLAPYGDATRFESLIESSFCLQENGTFRITASREQLHEYKDLFRGNDEGREQQRRDFAAALQKSVEKILFHVLQYFKSTTGHRNLCLAGGLAQNCTANGKVLAAGLFDRVFVQPAAYDAGCAVGAAIHGYLEAGGSLRPHELQHLYLGPSIPESKEVLQSLKLWSSVVEVEEPEDICQTVAELLVQGHVVAWVQGRAEFGARALGNRSILADPRPVENRQRINDMIKKREAFRPFAPSVLEEYLHEYFEVPQHVKSLPFMVFVADVRQQYRSVLGAITHVDGSARIQSVSQSVNPEYWRLINAFRELSGIPVLLNTSFNNRNEPIVTSLDDAMNCYLSTELDYLAVDKYLIRKKYPMDGKLSLCNLVPHLTHRFSLVRQSGADRRLRYEVHDKYRDTYLGMSKPAYCSLVEATEKSIPLGSVMPAHANGDSDSVAKELCGLWDKRVFTMNPH